MIDFKSATWAILKGRMQSAQAKALDALTMERDPIIAAEMRGRYAALKDFVELDRPPVEQPTEDATKKRASADSSGYLG